MRFLGLGWDPLAWQSDELKGWRLAFDRGDRFMVVAGRRGDVRAAGQLEHRGSDEPWAMAMVANDYLQKDLGAAVRGSDSSPRSTASTAEARSCRPTASSRTRFAHCLVQ